jgi:hypothetical protein
VRLDEWVGSPIAVQLVVNGTATYTLQGSLDDPNSPTNPVAPSAMNWASGIVANTTAATGNVDGVFIYFAPWVRVLLTSGSGSVTMTVIQLGAVVR